MKEFTLTQRDAREIYPVVTQEMKIKLEEHFGAVAFSADIMDRVVDVESACVELGYDFATLFDECYDKYAEAELSIKIVLEALREGTPAGECNWYPYFHKDGSGFRLDGAGYDDPLSHVSARLRVDSKEKALHAGKILEPQYFTYLTDPK